MSVAWRLVPDWWPMDPELLYQLSRPYYGLCGLEPAERCESEEEAERPALELDTTRRPLGGSW